MAMDRFVIAMIAETMYKEDLAKRLGLNPNSEYGRKKLNEYLEDERKSDELSAKVHLHNSNPGKFLSYTEIRNEAAKIRKSRLAPYIQKAKIIHEKRKKEQSVADLTPNSSKSGSLLAQITYDHENQEIDSAINTLNSIHQEQKTQDISMNETENNGDAQKKQEMYREAKTNMDKQKEMKFVLFHPVSICIKGNDFKYGVKDNLSYPIMLGFITEDNKCVDVISGREFDIISDEQYDHWYVKITDNTQIVPSPVHIYKKIDSSLENLKFIEKYITAKGHVSQKEIGKHNDFAWRLNRLFSYSNEFYSGEKSWNFSRSLFMFESPTYYLNKIDYINSASLAEFSYIQSGKKAGDDLNEKNNVIMSLRKKLTSPKK